jgi:hypothetical protein
MARSNELGMGNALWVSVRHQYRHGHRLQHGAGYATADELAQPRVGIGAHHDEVDTQIRGPRKQEDAIWMRQQVKS